MLTLALALIAASSSSSPASSSKADVLLLDLKPVGVDANEAKIVDGLVAEALGRELDRWPNKPRLATGNDIRTLVSLEADKAAAGCDDAGCMAEVAGAFGAHYVVTGTLGKLGSDRVLQLWLFDVQSSQTLARANASAPTSNALALDDITRRVLAPLAPAHVASTVVKPAAHDDGVSPIAITGGIVGGVGALAAIGAGAYALVLDQRLAAGSSATVADKKEALSIGPGVVVGAAIGAGVAAIGVAVLGVGVAL